VARASRRQAETYCDKQSTDLVFHIPHFFQFLSISIAPTVVCLRERCYRSGSGSCCRCLPEEDPGSPPGPVGARGEAIKQQRNKGTKRWHCSLLLCYFVVQLPAGEGPLCKSVPNAWWRKNEGGNKQKINKAANRISSWFLCSFVVQLPAERRPFSGSATHGLGGNEQQRNKATKRWYSSLLLCSFVVQSTFLFGLST